MPATHARGLTNKALGTQLIPFGIGLASYAMSASPATPAVHRGDSPGAPAVNRSAESRGAYVDDPAGASAPANGPKEKRMRVHAIDVGQGAATLFEFPCAAVLIDTGGENDDAFKSKEKLRSYLNDFFGERKDLKRTISLLVLSHAHKDHALNARMVAEEFTVKNVVTNGFTSGSGGPQQKWLQNWAKDNAKFEVITADNLPAGGKTSSVIDPVQCAEVDPKIRAFWGAVEEKPEEWSETEFDNGNNHSVVLRIDFDKASFLWSGDLEVDGIDALLEKQKKHLDVDVWEASHHGSYNGVSRDILKAMSPEIALFATGEESRHFQWTAWAYGHPRKQATDIIFESLGMNRRPVDRLVATGAKRFESERIEKAAFATGWDGTVVITATNEGRYSVATER